MHPLEIIKIKHCVPFFATMSLQHRHFESYPTYKQQKNLLHQQVQLHIARVPAEHVLVGCSRSVCCKIHNKTQYRFFKICILDNKPSLKLINDYHKNRNINLIKTISYEYISFLVLSQFDNDFNFRDFNKNV